LVGGVLHSNDILVAPRIGREGKGIGKYIGSHPRDKWIKETFHCYSISQHHDWDKHVKITFKPFLIKF